MSSTSPVFKALFNNREYTVRIALLNSKGDVVILKKSSIRSLKINDNIFNPFHTGTLEIVNDFNVLENSKTPYLFLGNGSDVMYLDIIPSNASDAFAISLQCIVTNSADRQEGNSQYKQVEFVEYGQYIMNAKYCSIFDLKKSAGNNSYLNTNAASSAPTGDWIKRIINRAFDGEPDDMSLFDVDAQTGQPIFDAENSSSINISPYASMTYGKLLTYIMQKHTHQNSPCVLTHDRTSKKFQLISLQRLFENHEKYTTEVLTYGDARQSDESRPSVEFKSCPVHFGQESQIYRFKAIEPSATFGVDHFSNEAVSSYSRAVGTFTYNMKALSKNEFMKTYEKMFVEPFKKLFSSNKSVANFNTQSLSNNTWADTTNTQPAAIGETERMNSKLASLLYMNYTYLISLPGNTGRQSRTFVDVYKQAQSSNSAPSRDDLSKLGRHLVTSVTHIFTQDTYTNQIETIKPYRLE
jgi:hypothetical protein